MAMVLTKDTFETEVMEAKSKVLIDFWAPRCMPCRMLTPVIEELSQTLDGRVKVCKVNVDEQPELAVKFGVMSIPMLVVMENGEVTAKEVGLMPKADILKMLGE